MSNTAATGKATLYLRGAGSYPLVEVEHEASASPSDGSGGLSLYVRGPGGLVAFAPGSVLGLKSYISLSDVDEKICISLNCALLHTISANPLCKPPAATT